MSYKECKIHIYVAHKNNNDYEYKCSPFAPRLGTVNWQKGFGHILDALAPQTFAINHVNMAQDVLWSVAPGLGYTNILYKRELKFHYTFQ